ncbi:MAG TPA: nitrate reductase cytochrome c-type subunit [Thiotrichales bacterium]|nr:nitrate reductase cytochrome c-type subunit [Thiotrichales bacterium]
MNKRLVFATALVTGLLIGGFGGKSWAEGVSSLRGDRDIAEESMDPDLKRWQPDREPIPRQFVQQPPLIPHAIKGYKINVKFNKCLTCHSWANYKEKGATKISQTHFTDRDGNVLANVSGRRYFCTQCHVPQVDAPPLVENEFTPVQALKQHH